MSAKNVNPRKRKLDNIAAKIAMFMMQDTFTDEEAAHKHLNEAIKQLDLAAKALIENNEKQ